MGELEEEGEGKGEVGWAERRDGLKLHERFRQGTCRRYVGRKYRRDHSNHGG